MSYDLGLYENSMPVIVDRHEEGGTYVLGGNTKAELNITWNYSKYYYTHLDKEDGLRWLYGKTGAETVQRLEHVVKILGIESHSDYWKPTPENAGRALDTLLRWARQHPNAVWDGD